MQINNSYQIATQAIQRDVNNLNKVAHAIAQTGTDNESNLTENMIELKKQEQQIKADFQIIKTQKEIDESLFDILA